MRVCLHKGLKMKYSLLLIMGIVTGAFSSEVKKDFEPLKNYYKRKLHTAVKQCKKQCLRKKEKEVDYIKKYGSCLMQDIANHLVAKKGYTVNTFENDHSLFLDFIAEILRKVNPECYKGELQAHLDRVNEAFNDMKEYKTKDQKRRKAQKKAWEYSDSPSVSIVVETFEHEDDID